MDDAMTPAFGGCEELREGPVRTVAASPEFVLEVLRANHRHQCSCHPDAEPDVELSFDTTVAEWRVVRTLVGTARLAAALNDDWELRVPAAEWRAVLEPPKSRTLRDVCALIASHATQVEVLSVGRFGASSRSAGAFLAVRSILISAGANPASITPSRPIADLARRFPAEFLGPISKLAPDRLPTVAIKERAAVLLAVSSFVLLVLAPAAVLVAGWLGFRRWLTELGVVVAVLGALGVVGFLLAARRAGPLEVRFGNLVTFRDLAEAIADEPRPAVQTHARADVRGGAERGI